MGLVLYLLVFPAYHGLYPLLARRRPHSTAKGRMDLLRRSWIERVIRERDVVAAAQTTRNLAMTNSLLGSAALILMGMTANLLLSYPKVPDAVQPAGWEAHPAALTAKLYLLIVVFAVAFSYYMAALRRLGQFNLVIGADPELIDREEGSSAAYLTELINRASNRYTLGVRAFFSAFPLFAWLFDSWLFLGLTLFFAIKFVVFQDFTRLLRPARS